MASPNSVKKNVQKAGESAVIVALASAVSIAAVQALKSAGIDLDSDAALAVCIAVLSALGAGLRNWSKHRTVKPMDKPADTGNGATA